MSNLPDDYFADIYWTKFGKMRFYQIYKNEYIKQLPIVERFAKSLRHILPENVTVRHPGMLSWKFDIVEISDVLYFGGEWEGFVRDHQLQEGDIITFKYKKDQRIDALVFAGKTFCEKESSYFIDPRQSTGVYTKKNVDSSTNEVKSTPLIFKGSNTAHCSKGNTESENVSEPHTAKRASNRKKMPFSPLESKLLHCNLAEDKIQNQSGRSKVSNNQGRHDLSPRMSTSMHNDEVTPPNSSNPAQYDMSAKRVRFEVDVEPLNSKQKKNCKTASYRHKQASDKGNNIQSSKTSNSQNNQTLPHYKEAKNLAGKRDLVMLMRRSYVEYGFSMTIQTEWARKYMPKKSQQIILRMKGLQWAVNYLVREKSYVFTAGWNKFVADSDLHTNDVCLFHIGDAGLTTFILDVKIFHNQNG